MSPSRVFLLFALLGGVVMFAEVVATQTHQSATKVIGGNPRTWGPPLHGGRPKSSANAAHPGGSGRFILMALMGAFVLFLLLG